LFLLRFKQTRSQPDSGVQKNQSNTQSQNIRPQNPSNINNKPIERNVQQAPNYQPQQQQQQQNYRLPSGQPTQPTNYQQNPQAQPFIRPPVNPGVRPINPQQQQPPPIRNIPPNANQPIRPPINQNQQQFRPPPPPQQHQQQFQRPNFSNQGPSPDQQQFRPQQPPVNLQRQPFPEQKLNRNQPQNMTEINRERTFTTSNEVSADDDDDVVVGRMTTPQTKPNVKPLENYEQRPAPPQQPLQQGQPMQKPQQQQPEMQRRESVKSIPSRPPSGLGSNNSQSPEPRTNPAPQAAVNVQKPPVQQQQQRGDPSNRNNPNEISRQSPNNYDNTRDSVELSDRNEKVQRSVNNAPQQRQSPENIMQKPIMNQQPPQQMRPVSQNQEQRKPEQQPPPSALKSQDQPKSAENQNRKSAVRLDLGDSKNMKDKFKSPTSKTK
jgi:hypothetical protein